jgi:hypothetical protein
MKYIDVLVTPEEVDAISNVVIAFKQLNSEEFTNPDADVVAKWVAYAKGVLYKEWQELEDGDYLKEAYRNDVWAWNDSDLYS